MGMPTLYFWSIPCQHVYMRVCQLCVSGPYPVNTSLYGYANFVYLLHTLSTRLYVGMPALCTWSIPCQHVYMGVCQLCVSGPYPVNTSIWGYASFAYLVHTLSTRLYGGMSALRIWSIPCQHIYMGVCQLCVSGPYPVNTSICGYASFVYLVCTLSTRLYVGMPALRIWSASSQLHCRF